MNKILNVCGFALLSACTGGTPDSDLSTGSGGGSEGEEGTGTGTGEDSGAEFSEDTSMGVDEGEEGAPEESEDSGDLEEGSGSDTNGGGEEACTVVVTATAVDVEGTEITGQGVGYYLREEPDSNSSDIEGQALHSDYHFKTENGEIEVELKDYVETGELSGRCSLVFYSENSVQGAALQFDCNCGENISLGKLPIATPTTLEVSEENQQPVDIGGLLINFDHGSWEFPPSVGEYTVGGTRVPKENWPNELIDQEILQVWSVSPFGLPIKADSPIRIEVLDQFEEEVGRNIGIYTLSGEIAGLMKSGGGTIVEGGTVDTDQDVNLGEAATWVILTVE